MIRESTSGQSEIIGVLLLIAISLVSIGIISVYSTPTILQGTEYISSQEAENGFASLDARITSVTSGSSVVEPIEMGVGSEKLVSEPESVHINITQEYTTAPWDNRSLYEGEIGRLSYSKGDEVIAYEGGAVFRKQPQSNGSVMVSEPSILHNGETLGVSIHNITSGVSVSGTSKVTLNPTAETEVVFPNTTYTAPGEEKKMNPLENGTVYITVESKFFSAWADFFNETEQTEVKSINSTDGEGTVRARLLRADSEVINSAGVSEEKFRASSDPFDGNFTDGISYPEPDAWIRDIVRYARSNPDVKNVTECDDALGCDGSYPGVFYTDGSYTLGDTATASLTTNRNVTLVVDGRLTVDELSVSGNPNYQARIVSTDGVTFADGYSVSVNNRVTRLSMYTLSGNTVEFAGSGTGEGVVYAPGSTVSLNRMDGGDWTGSFVAESIDASATEGGTDINFGGKVGVGQYNTTRYLQITEKKINID